MRSILFVFAVALSIATFGQAKNTINTSDFANAFGPWKGALTYLDYTSGKPYTMPANVTLENNSAKASEIILAFVYPNEPKANGNDTLRISKDGTLLNGAKIISKKLIKEDVLEIIADINGIDGNDNKKAVLRHTYTIGKNNFSNRKDVKFDGTEQWIKRNEYVFSR